MVPQSSSTSLTTEGRWKRRAAKVALPVVGLSLLAIATAYAVYHAKEARLNMSLLLRLSYAGLFAVGMEYFARYAHLNAWHSTSLWCYHASHHHQKAVYGEGPTANQKKIKANRIDTSAFELNDIFPITFASLSIPLIYWCVFVGEPTTFKDCLLGACAGISGYGTSYFTGHDLCAHQRGGPELAAFLRRLSPTLAHCADVHTRYHHTINANVSDDEDPYGPPYGFWLGPNEVRDYLAGDRVPKGMPWQLRWAFRGAYAFMLYAALDQWNIISHVR